MVLVYLRSRICHVWTGPRTDRSSATAATRRVNSNSDGPPPFAAHG